MEPGAVDELYGDLGEDHREAVLNADEDSVDIYSGLDDSPKKNVESSKSGALFSPLRLRESMDLYEELITKEQEEKNATYNELKTKFDAAEKQVQELLAKLQQMQTMNSSLHKENIMLKKNICALIKTARTEIIRKDEEISKLSKRSSQGGLHIPRMDISPASTYHNINNKDILNLRSQGLPKTPRLQDEPNRLKQTTELTAGELRQSPSVVQSYSPKQDHKPQHPDSSNCKEDSRSRILATSKSKEITDVEKPQIGTQKNQKGSLSDQNPAQHPEAPATSLRSGRLRSPSSRPHHGSPSLTASQPSKEPTNVNPDGPEGKKETVHRHPEERQSRRTERSSGKGGKSCPEQSPLGRLIKEHHRKEERRQDDGGGSGKRCTRSDGTKEHEMKRKHNSEDKVRTGGSRDDRRSTRSETSKERDPSAYKVSKGVTKGTGDANEKHVKDKDRRDKSHGHRQSHVKPDSKKKHERDKEQRRRSGKTEEPKNKTSRSHDDLKVAKGLDNNSGKERPRMTTDRKAKNKEVLPPAGKFHATESSAHASKPPSSRLSTSVTILTTPEESSPKRKLSFMETLNLTLSPIKKHHPDEAKDPPPASSAIEDNSLQDQEMLALEDFQVIDETRGSQQSIEEELTPTTVEAPTQPSETINTDTLCTQNASSEGLPTKQVDPVVKAKEPEAAESLNKELFGSPTKQQEVNCVPKTSEDGSNSISPESPEPQEENPPGDLESVGTSPVPAVNSVCEQKESSEEAVAKKDHLETDPILNPTPQIHTDPPPQVSSSTADESVPPSLKTEVISITEELDVSSQAPADCVDVQAGTTSPAALANDLTKENHEQPDSEVTEEEAVPPKWSSPSEPDSTEMQPSKNLTSIVGHDDDSMMWTLSNIKVIPEAISPLTSPVRQKKGEQQQLGKEQQHVRSLNQDFSSSTVVTDEATIKMDMNKENKRPDSSILPTVQSDKQEVLTSTDTQSELEEGEILSEADEDEALVIQSSPVKPQSPPKAPTRSPRLSTLEKLNQARSSVTPSRRNKGKNPTPVLKESPTSSKRRFKVVTIPPKAKVLTSSDFMDMLSYIRAKLRRKYMKLHKNVTKAAFGCIVDMSLASFAEFVDSVNFARFCSQGHEIKPKLNKIICTVMGQVSCNGIVNRIFEQQADDLKLKLWNFVDGQLDFLFKELKAALSHFKMPSKKRSVESSTNKKSLENCLIQPKEPLGVAQNRSQPPTNVREQSECQQKVTTFHQSLPCRVRGLGSRGKNIKVVTEEAANVSDSQPSHLPVVVSEKVLKETPLLQEKSMSLARRVPHGSSMHDRTDFEILTEQQTSSLTFNLVTDSQMGDIFRSLLQGSDLLEASGSGGDHHSWPANTPRKECPSGESLIGVMTPNKIVTTWTTISPYKFASPNGKFQMSVNPALLDENCLLEVPLTTLSNEAIPTLSSSHQTYSVLAEDLAVSLTIPSPLKSDGHLSFLNPVNGQPLSVTPSEVISAHYSEDALLEGEDATEQDIHLSLDTDNSSSTSSTSGTWQVSDSAAFQFKPNLPMQAEVTERSNDHFVVRIRHAVAGLPEENKQKPKSSTLIGNEDASASGVQMSNEVTSAVVSFKGEVPTTLSKTTRDNDGTSSETDPSCGSSTSGVIHATVPHSSTATKVTAATHPCTSAATKVIPASPDPRTFAATSITTTSEPRVPDESTPVTQPTGHRKTRKRRKHHSLPKAKRSRRERSHEKHETPKQKRTKCLKTPSKKTPSPPASPNSLSAKNVIRKKGEVVVTWTREEDRDILVELKMKGPSSKTFAALSSKLRKSQEQIEERFAQLMKLFKKKEKLEN